MEKDDIVKITKVEKDIQYIKKEIEVIVKLLNTMQETRSDYITKNDKHWVEDIIRTYLSENISKTNNLLNLIKNIVYFATPLATIVALFKVL